MVGLLDCKLCLDDNNVDCEPVVESVVSSGFRSDLRTKLLMLNAAALFPAVSCAYDDDLVTMSGGFGSSALLVCLASSVG